MHLPETKRRELEAAAALIRESVPVEKIILFGSYARGGWKEEKDLPPERKSGHASDYDILAVTETKETARNTALWKMITDKTADMGLTAHVRIIACDIQELNIKLAEGQYFYSDIVKEGIMLHDSGKSGLARKRRLKPEEKQRIAQDHFDHWYERSTGLYNGYADAIKRNDLKTAAFLLNQTTESAYKTILLVFTNYNPHEHYLHLLGGMVENCDKEIADHFRAETPREEELFNLLNYAYIGARYDASFHIGRDELEALSGRVKRLIDMTEKICRKKIAGFTG